MYQLAKNILFQLPPEQAHHLVMKGLQTLTKVPGAAGLLKSSCSISDPKLERTVFGLRFPNPVGLAAGFDKDARYIDELACLGFGFVEIGTVTPLPQPGNDKPRLFRLPADQALINRMGFNNEGALAAAGRLRKSKQKLIIGGNIGKNKITPNEDAISDYEKCFHALYEVVDYFVVNVSSPNTPNLRALQEKEPLTKLLQHLQKCNSEKPVRKPILLKIAPDLGFSQLDDILQIVQDTGLDGIVATNTTIAREDLQTDMAILAQIGAGGLSGRPLRARATEIVKYIATRSNGHIPVIAVGGIFTAGDAREKLDAGASLVQVYTGFIYEGPTIAKNICRGLLSE